MSKDGVLDEALRRLDAGDEAGAVSLLDDAAQRIEARDGPSAVATAAAWHDRARLAVMMDDLDRGVECLRDALRVDSSTEQGLRDSLTYGLDLGRTLLRRGDLDEAGAVLREGVSRRQAHYGADHPGLGVGLQAMAEWEWTQGNLDEAADLAERAVGLLWPARDAQAPSAMGLRACIAAGVGRPVVFAPDDLPVEWVEDVAAETCRNLDGRDPRFVLGVFGQLIDWVGSRQGDLATLLVHLHAERAEAARAANDHDARLESLEAADALAESLDDRDLALRAAQGLALAQQEAGDLDAAEETYRTAADRAEAAGLRDVRSNVLRNYGLFLVETERDLEAEAVLRESIAEAESIRHDDLTGRALTALGVFFQHDHRLAEARPLLSRAIALLGATHADALLARSHLQAVDRGIPCGCGDQEASFAALLRQLVEPRLPAGLIASLSLDPEAGVAVDLTRAPTDAEAQLLDRVIQESMRTLQSQLNARG